MKKEELLKKIQPDLSENSLQVVKKRYLQTDLDGNPTETPAEMFYRVAEYMAQAEDFYSDNPDKEVVIEDFYTMMAELRYLPGGRVLFAAHKDTFNQLHSCYVLPVDDSMNSIFSTLKEASIIHQYNGGTGFNFSQIRPKGDKVKNIPGVAFGPIKVIEIFSDTLGKILQGGKRSGANMGIIDVSHPDIYEFIHMKDSGAKIFNFNISVGVTDEFMKAVEEDGDHHLINPRNGEVVKTVKARELFDEICENAWRCADPGMIFLDALERRNPTPELDKQNATNPCGEQPLLPYESCNIGSIVLPQHVKDGQVDWETLRKTVRTAVHMMDNNIDVNNYPLKKIEERVRFGNRRIGLGILGFGQMLYHLGIPYNSEEAVNLCGEVMNFINEEGWKKSEELAEARGVFPNWEISRFSGEGRKVRNATITTIAPTGTISMVANSSGGIEPVFSLVTIRRSFFEDSSDRTSAGKTMTWVDPFFEKELKKRGLYSRELLEKISEEGSLQNIEEIPEDLKKIFVTTHDITYDWHVKMQAAAQVYTDNAVSKTINMRRTSTVENVKDAYIKAWKGGCLGITIYRDGSKEMQVLNTSKTAKREVTEDHERWGGSGNGPNKVYTKENTPTGTAIFPNATYTALPFSENAKTLLNRTYAHTKSDGSKESPEEIFSRVAQTLAEVEHKYNKTPEFISGLKKQYYEIMINREFTPAGRTITNAGTPMETVANCIVLPIDDSMDSIFKTLKDAALLQKQGAGIGFSFSRIRPKGSSISKKPLGEATGPVSFLRLYNAAFSVVWEADKRQGAYMAILRVDHPDIEEFIAAKTEENEINKFNISVGITDKFMEAVENDEDFELINPKTGEAEKKINAKKLFDKIIHHAWLNGEPGLAFLDEVNRTNPVPGLGEIESSNPCGEQFLHPYDVCNLGSINLEAFVKNGNVDYGRLREVTKTAVRLLDNVVDDSAFMVPEVNDVSKGNRRVGLGVMGFSYMLYQLGIKYGSPESLELAEKVMQTIKNEAHKTSAELAEEKGLFPNYHLSIYPDQGVPMRNAALTTVAPTGKISMIFDTSSGIEPEFALVYSKQDAQGNKYFYTNKYLERALKERNLYNDEIMKKIAEKGSLQDIDEIPSELKEVFVVSGDIKAENHIRMQAAFQKYVDNSISKTINFPNSATEDDVRQGYFLAWKLKCKGCTVYRDGSRTMQVLNIGKEEKKSADSSSSADRSADKGTENPGQCVHLPEPRPRPENVRGTTYKVGTGYGTLFVTINDDEDGYPFEVFATIGKTGGVFAAKSEAICRLISLALRCRIDTQVIIDQLKGIRGPMPHWHKGKMVLSIPDAISQVLQDHVTNAQQHLDLKYSQPKAVEKEEAVEMISENRAQLNQGDILAEAKEEISSVAVVKSDSKAEEKSDSQWQNVDSKASLADLGISPECPDCGGLLELSEGCVLCRGCGYSKCG